MITPIKTMLAQSVYTFLAATIASVLTWVSPANAAFIYQDLYVPGSLATAAQGINDAGVVVGWYQMPDSESKGFVWSSGIFSDLPMNQAYGINNLGEIVGHIGSQAVLYSGGVISPIIYPGAQYSTAWGINDAGTIVGEFIDPTSGYTNSKAYVYSGAVFSELVVPGFPEKVAATGITNSGVIVGYAGASGFVLDAGAISFVQHPDAPYGTTYFHGISNDEEIIGVHFSGGIATNGFVYQYSQFTSVMYPGTPQTTAMGINTEGKVVGRWWDFQNNIGHAFIAIPDDQGGIGNVSEPGTLNLIVFGFAALALHRKPLFRRP